ncbi:MAG TPA: aldehyde dehydrogenase [Clostridia bacterium]|nr:aldehyde dehydrogenase [Clostridia bacterium]
MIQDIVKNQREFFLTGETLDIDFRLTQLKKLRNSLIQNQTDIYNAFMADYHKCEFDVVSTELGMVISEIDFMLSHLKKLAKPKKVRSNLINFPSRGLLVFEPYGVSLIMSPWNYPLQLALAPLVGAIAGGNTAVVKPGNYAPEVSKVIRQILSVFDEKYIATVLGGRDENIELLDQRFDFIFFTGGTIVGKLVMEKAAKNLTPVVLELGGKSPCIVDNDANIDLAAKRVAWGKYLNAGQTCVAPDYALVHKTVLDKFTERLIFWIKNYYYSDGKITENFTHIINDKHVERLHGLIDKNKVVFGGAGNGRLLEPVIMTNITRSDAVMGEEIFGPILPILTFDDFIAEIDTLKRLEKPLALYYFGSNNAHIEKISNEVSFGGGCINDVIMHLTTETLPFGGAGNSGMGSYHGKKSFETFTHQKSILHKGKAEINLKYPPYSDKKLKFIKTFMKCK